MYVVGAPPFYSLLIFMHNKVWWDLVHVKSSNKPNRVTTELLSVCARSVKPVSCDTRVAVFPHEAAKWKRIPQHANWTADDPAPRTWVDRLCSNSNEVSNWKRKQSSQGIFQVLAQSEEISDRQIGWETNRSWASRRSASSSTARYHAGFGCHRSLRSLWPHPSGRTDPIVRFCKYKFEWLFP